MPEKKNLAQVKAKPVPGEIRSENHEGRSYLVIPVVALKEAVVKGQFLPGEEIKLSQQLWDDVPVPVTHPNTNSARKREIVERYSLGRLYGSMVSDKKLKGEVWIDEEKAFSKGAQNNSARAQELFSTYERLKAGEPMDVSTSYWHDTVDETGTYNGQPYNGRQVNIRPDHLALLPDETGELSLPDGVGVPLKNRRGRDVKTDLVRSSARTPTYSDTSEGDWNRQTLSEFANQRGWDVSSVADMTDEQRSIAAKSSLLGTVDTDDWNVLTFFQVVDGNGVLYKNALTTVRGGRGQSADISESAWQSAADKAKQLLQDEFDVEYEENSRSILEKAFRLFRGEKMSNKQELVDKLKGRMDVPEGNLLDTSEDVLKEMIKLADESEETTEETETQETPEEEEEEEEEGKEKTENSGTKIEDLVEEKVRETLEKERRSDLINKLDNSKDVDFSRDELESMKLSALEKVEQKYTPGGNYAGAGGVFEQMTGEDEETVEAAGYFGNKDNGGE